MGAVVAPGAERDKVVGRFAGDFACGTHNEAAKLRCVLLNFGHRSVNHHKPRTCRSSLNSPHQIADSWPQLITWIRNGGKVWPRGNTCVTSAKNSSLNPHRDSKLPRHVTGTKKPFMKHMFKKRTLDSVQKRRMRGGRGT